MNVLLCSGAPRSSRVRDFLHSRCSRLVETPDRVDLPFLQAEKIDWIVSHGYGPIFREPAVSAYAGRIVNIHNTFLPWGRGIMGNVWSYFDDSPKGVTLHYIDAGIDTGSVITRQLADLPPDATLQSSWDLLMDRLEELFLERWDSIVAAGPGGMAQGALPELGSYRSRRQSQELLALLPRRWETPVAEVAALGREYRDDPAAFERRHGVVINPAPGDWPPDGSDQECVASLRQARMRGPAAGAARADAVLEAVPAGPEDMLVNWLWVNDPVTRRMFKLNDYVGWEGHCRWFKGLLKDPDRLLCIGRAGQERIGNVRLDRRYDDVWEVSINIAPGWRGLGLGSRLIEKATQVLLARRPVSRLFAMAKRVNMPSINSFRRVGFPERTPEQGIPGLERFDPDTEVYMERTLKENA